MYTAPYSGHFCRRPPLLQTCWPVHTFLNSNKKKSLIHWCNQFSHNSHGRFLPVIWIAQMKVLTQLTIEIVNLGSWNFVVMLYIKTMVNYGKVSASWVWTFFLFRAVESFNGIVLGSFLFFLVQFLVLFQFNSVQSLVSPVNIM